MTEERFETIPIGVTTTDGDRTAHTYFLSSTDDVMERLEFFEALARLIWRALKAQNDVLAFSNPYVLYRSDHVTSIEVTSTELMDELDKLSESAIG